MATWCERRWSSHEAGHLTEVDTYYSRPDVDYMKTVERLRIRHRDGFAEITYKPPPNASGITDYLVVGLPYRDLVMAAAH
ncbi:CYTH domain-containing protein [Nocardia sp. NPDC051990]|uniref:CYTH domain-containing protein n=1 Tax=Nocardia sp. NPDC051990 TaxID=3155285 RepID=UPI003413F75E